MLCIRKKKTVQMKFQVLQLLSLIPYHVGRYAFSTLVGKLLDRHAVNILMDNGLYRFIMQAIIHMLSA